MSRGRNEIGRVVVGGGEACQRGAKRHEDSAGIVFRHVDPAGEVRQRVTLAQLQLLGDAVDRGLCVKRAAAGKGNVGWSRRCIGPRIVEVQNEIRRGGSRGE